ncbi:uncharacterized protein METZ01_LOCUS412386, partial [marine metagenome]
CVGERCCGSQPAQAGRSKEKLFDYGAHLCS